MLTPFDCHEPRGRPGDRERLAPLVLQPQMKSCLRNPLDVLTMRDWDRAMARHAFHAALPSPIRNRRNKGGIDVHMRFTVERDRPSLRERLLEEELVRAGMLARPALARALAVGPEIKTRSGESLEYAASRHGWRVGGGRTRQGRATCGRLPPERQGSWIKTSKRPGMGLWNVAARAMPIRRPGLRWQHCASPRRHGPMVQ